MSTLHFDNAMLTRVPPDQRILPKAINRYFGFYVTFSGNDGDTSVSQYRYFGRVPCAKATESGLRLPDVRAASRRDCVGQLQRIAAAAEIACSILSAKP
jgi:hypothetical protein